MENYDQMSFDFFGALEEESEEEVKEPRKGKAQAKKSAAKKEPARNCAEEKIGSPAYIMFLPGRTTELIVPDQTSVKDAIAEAGKRGIPFCQSGITDCLKKNGNSLIPAFKTFNMKAKGDVKLAPAAVVIGPDGLPVNELFMGDAVDASEIIGKIREHLPEELKEIPVSVISPFTASDRIFAVFQFENSKEVKETETDSEELYELVLPNGDTESFDGEGGKLLDEASEKLGCFKENLLLWKLGDTRFLASLNFCSPGSTGTSVSAPKEETFPVEGYTISLMFREYPLSPEDFEGKKEITKEDVKAFLVNHGHRDFGIADFTVDEFKEAKRLICTIRGSKKGVGDEHPLFYSDAFGDICFRAGVTAFPLEAIDFLFLIAMRNRERGELLLELFYEPTAKKYLFIYPRQKQTSASVEADYDAFFEHPRLSGLIKVGEFHSHALHRAFWSMTDNVDEKYKPGLYAVIGNLGCDPEIRFRFSTGDGFTDYDAEEFYARFCERNGAFVNDDSYAEVLDAPVNENPVRFAITDEDGSCFLECGSHEVHVLSAVPGLTLKRFVIGDGFSMAASITGRKSILSGNCAESFYELFLASEAQAKEA